MNADRMKQRRGFPGGRPLPRLGDQAHVARAVSNALSVERIVGRPTIKDRQRALAYEMSRSTSYVGRMMRGDVGVKPPMAWEIGWALRNLGIEWISGPLLLATVPAFQGHLLGVIAEVLKPGPTASIKRWWPTLSLLSETYGAAYEVLWSKISPAPLAGDALHKAIFPLNDIDARLRRVARIDDELTKEFHSAWRRWWDREETEHLAAPFADLIEALRLNKSDRVRDVLEDELFQWFEDVPDPKEWSSCGRYMKKKPLKFTEAAKP